jgi:hypothetical protein
MIQGADIQPAEDITILEGTQPAGEATQPAGEATQHAEGEEGAAEGQVEIDQP